jgi:HK97 family phage major capsid protein
MNKKMREIKAQIEALNEEAKNLFEAKDVEGAEKKLDAIDALEKEYKIAERLFQGEKEEVTNEVIDKVKSVNKVKAFADNIKKIRNSMNEGTGTDGGYTVPEDVSTDIEKLREAKFSLEQLVSVESVSTMSGKRTYKKRSSQTGFSKVGEAGKIGSKATPKYDRIEYSIDKYAGILPVTNELFDDSDANIYSELTEWIADESRVTRNKLILEQVNTKARTKIAGLDGIKKVLNVTLGQAFKPTSVIVTNDDGLNYLDTLKDSDGKYLLSASPADPMKMVLAAGATSIPVRVIPNADLANESVYTTTSDTDVVSGKTYYTRTGSGTTASPYVYTVVETPAKASISTYYEVTAVQYPFIIGDLKEGIKFYDRKKLNIMTSNTAAAGELNAFEEDLTLFRAIEREDVVVRDKDAFVNGYIEISTVASA